MALKIEYVRAGDLKPYANNAKLHPAEQVEQIKKSIEQFGFNDPIAVWKDNEVVEGHGRLQAVLEKWGGVDTKYRSSVSTHSPKNSAKPICSYITSSR